MTVTRDNFSDIYERHKNTVYSIAVSYLKNIDDAMDVTQEAFIKLLDYTGEFENDEHVKAWLLRVTINHSKNVLRSKKHTMDEIPEDLPYIDKHQDNELLKLVLKLPEKYRIPIHLFYYEEYSIKEIAQCMDLPESTVKVRLKRGREKLGRDLVKENWDE